jgi:hypothetical protein
MAAGVPLGRLVVVEPGSEAEEARALAALVREVTSMAGRPDRRRSVG